MSWGLVSLMGDQLAFGGSPVGGIVPAFPVFPHLGPEAGCPFWAPSITSQS